MGEGILFNIGIMIMGNQLRKEEEGEEGEESFLKTPTTDSTEVTHLTLTISLPGYGYHQSLDSSFLPLLKLKQNHRGPCPHTDITLRSRWGVGWFV